MKKTFETEYRALLERAEEFMALPQWGDKAVKKDWNRRLAEWKCRLSAPWRLAIVGMVKEGKSTFINALLGYDWLATGAAETTGTICLLSNKIADNPEQPVRCVYKDGRPDEWMSIDGAKLLQGTDPDQLRFSEQLLYLEYCLGQYGIPLLESCELVDTPGTGACVGSNYDAHDRVTFGYLSNVDAVALIVQDTLRAGNRDILDRFSDACCSHGRKGNVTGHLLYSKSDVGCYSVNELESGQLDKCCSIRREAMENYGFDGTIRVRAIAPLLAKAIKHLGLVQVSRVFYTLYPEGPSPLDSVPKESKSRARKILCKEMLPSMETLDDLILDVILRSSSPEDAISRVNKLAGIESFRDLLMQEMSEQVPLSRMLNLLGDMQRWVEVHKKILDSVCAKQNGQGESSQTSWGEWLMQLRELRMAITEELNGLRHEALRQYDAQVQSYLLSSIEKEKLVSEGVREESALIAQQNAELDEKIGLLQKDNETLEAELGKSSLQVAEQKDLIEGQNKDLDEQKRMVAQLTQDKYALQQRVKDLVDAELQLSEEKSGLQDQLADMERLVGINKSHLEPARERCRLLEEERNELLKEVELKKASLTRTRRIYLGLMAGVALAFVGFVCLQTGPASHSDVDMRHRSECGTESAAAERLSNDAGNSESENSNKAQYKEELAKLQQTVESQARQLKKVEGVIAALNKLTGTAPEKYETLPDYVDQLISAYAASREARQQAVGQLASVQEQYKKLESEHAGCAGMAEQRKTFERIITELCNNTGTNPEDYESLPRSVKKMKENLRRTRGKLQEVKSYISGDFVDPNSTATGTSIITNLKEILNQ